MLMKLRWSFNTVMWMAMPNESTVPVSVLEDEGETYAVNASNNGLSPLMVGVILLLLVGVGWVISLSWRKKE